MKQSAHFLGKVVESMCSLIARKLMFFLFILKTVGVKISVTEEARGPYPENIFPVPFLLIHGQWLSVERNILFKKN